MVTVREAYLSVKQTLAGAGIENASQEADILFETAIGKRRFSMQPDYPLQQEQADTLRALAKKRAGHYPLQYLCGSWPFMEIELTVGEGVLIPRSDTECVVEKALELIAPVQQPRVLDLCSGSGAIAAAVKYYRPEADVTAVELSEKAMRYLRLNCGHIVTAVQADVFQYQEELPEEDLHLIVSNPPYVTCAEMQALAPELRFEPSSALLGGEDGLDFYRHIIKAYFTKLKKGGNLVVETGSLQAQAVASICRQAGYTDITCTQDWAGLDRCIAARRP